VRVCSGRFVPEKETWYTFCRMLGGFQGWSGYVRKISSPLGFDLRSVKPVLSSWLRYPNPEISLYFLFNKIRRQLSVKICKKETGKGGNVPGIHNLGSVLIYVVSFTAGHYVWEERNSKRRKLFACLGIEPRFPVRPPYIRITILSEVSWFFFCFKC
jgi:hypothetical protein